MYIALFNETLNSSSDFNYPQCKIILKSHNRLELFAWGYVVLFLNNVIRLWQVGRNSPR